MDNTLICVGILGNMTCYLNISEEEAIKRYKEEVGYDDYRIIHINFKDRFGAYDVEQLD